MRHVFLLGALGVLLAGCDSNEPAVPPLQTDLLALAPGVTYVYERVLTDTRLDSLGRPDTLAFYRDTSELEVLRDDATLGEVDGLIEVVERGPNWTYRGWYELRSDGLYLHGWQGGSDAAPRYPAGAAWRAEVLGTVHAPFQAYTRADTALASAPHRVLVYPLAAGVSWEMNAASETSARRTREIRGAASRDTPAGAFRCAEIATEVDWATIGIARPDGYAWTDCIAGQAVVEREFRTRGYQEYRGENNAVLFADTVDAVQRVTLIERVER